jgi:hypothetical protein
VAKIRRKPGSESAGYHYDAVPKGPSRKSRTPVKAPPKGMAARGPAGDYAGAAKDYATAVASLPPAARIPTERATAAATRARARGKLRRQTRTLSRIRRRANAVTHKADVSIKPKKIVVRKTVAKAPLSPKAKPISLPATPTPVKPAYFTGKPTVGEPTQTELFKAQRQGTLKTNRKGAVVTPAVKKVSRRLHKAEARSAQVSGLEPDEEKFVNAVSRGTGGKLSPRTVAAWTRLEGGNSTGDWNRLNIGHTDSGPIALTADERWRDPEQAGHLTAAFLKGEFGGPSPKIAAIIHKAKGKSPEQQLQVIAATDWATDPEYASKLQATLASVGPAGKPVPAKLMRRAKQLGLDVGGKALGPAPKKVVTRFKAAKVAMKEVEGLPYVWGGGHGSPSSSPTGGGLDCSGAVGYVLNKIGAMKGSLTSGSMGSVLKPGPGAITVFYNPTHTFMRVGNEYWGTSVGDSGSGGLGPHPAPSASYLAQYSVGHVAGLGRKQALQLGFKDLGSGGSSAFPGMTLSSSGTTATIDSGAGATKAKPGFSKAPIILTPFQKLQKFKQGRLRQDKLSEREEASTPKVTGSALKTLERKYGAG